LGIPAKLRDYAFIDGVTPEFGDIGDVGVGRLDPFDPGCTKVYPIFKDPSKNFDPGTSLCKLGFPFHSFEPTWNKEREMFELPPRALPMPRFPIDGIFTRTAEVVIEGSEPPPFPVRYVETSSPGLKGQSGGPTVDVKGTIWAIQAKTINFPLGFDPSVPGKKDQTEHQFLNVGLGVHPITIFGLFNQVGIKFQVSDY
jgi:hypothetical protein